LVPAVLFLVALLVFWSYPISRRYAEEVRAELDTRRRKTEEPDQ
jgi:Na+/melibiose symporter-like transporter